MVKGFNEVLAQISPGRLKDFYQGIVLFNICIKSSGKSCNRSVDYLSGSVYAQIVRRQFQ